MSYNIIYLSNLKTIITVLILGPCLTVYKYMYCFHYRKKVMTPCLWPYLISAIHRLHKSVLTFNSNVCWPWPLALTNVCNMSLFCYHWMHVLCIVLWHYLMCCDLSPLTLPNASNVSATDKCDAPWHASLILIVFLYKLSALILSYLKQKKSYI